MYSQKNSFLTLSLEIELFINKYYKQEILRGLLLSSVFLVLLVAGAWFLEFLFRFSSLGRGVLLFGGILIILIYVSKFVLYPLIKLFGLYGRMSYDEASVLLSEKIPEIGDKLINVIGLERQLKSNETDLLKASIEQKALSSLRFDFKSAISINDQKKCSIGFCCFFLFLVLVLLFILTLLFPLSRGLFFFKKVLKILIRLCLRLTTACHYLFWKMNL